MSRIGIQPITIPAGVTVSRNDDTVTVAGPKGTLTYAPPHIVHVETRDQTVVVSVGNPQDMRQRAQWGTARALLANMVQGVFQGFSKRLEVKGIGYKVELKGDTVLLSVGYSHAVPFRIPKDVQVQVEKNVITVSGADRQKVGAVAAQLRLIKKPEPYKGKGIQYAGEAVRRKAGKVAKAVGAK